MPFAVGAYIHYFPNKSKLLGNVFIFIHIFRHNSLPCLFCFYYKILFYNWSNKKIVLSSGKEIDYNKEYLGIPTLINYVPDEIYEEFINKLNLIDRETISLVSEIEYSPSTVNDKVIDDKRFLFRMNDGNTVYINTINIEKFNNYLEIYEVIVNKNGNVTGCLYLDSNSENKHFNNCESNPIVEEEVEDNGEN